MKKFFAAALFPALALQVCSQESGGPFTVSATMRHRFELRDGYQAPAVQGMVPAVLVWQRTRLSLFFESGPVTLKVTPQDARLWGDESISSSTGIFGDDASVELYEAWMEIRIGSGPVSLRMGRQELKSDNRRLLSERNWNNHGLTYDAVRLQATVFHSDIQIGISWNSLVESSSGNPYPADRIKMLDYLRFHHRWKDLASLSLVHVASGVTATDTSDKLSFRQTSGFYSEYGKHGIKAWCDAYYQYGRNRDGLPVRAFLLGSDVHLVSGRILPGMGFLYLSGTPAGSSDMGRDGLFDILYGARHRYCGFMDYFTNIPKQTMSRGLADLYLDVEYEIRGNLVMRDAGHYFLLARRDTGASGGASQGFENDLTVLFRPCDEVSVETGWLFFIATPRMRSMQAAGGTRFSQFVYVQFNLATNPFKINHHEAS